VISVSLLWNPLVIVFIFAFSLHVHSIVEFMNKGLHTCFLWVTVNFEHVNIETKMDVILVSQTVLLLYSIYHLNHVGFIFCTLDNILKISVANLCCIKNGWFLDACHFSYCAYECFVLDSQFLKLNMIFYELISLIVILLWVCDDYANAWNHGGIMTG